MHIIGNILKVQFLLLGFLLAIGSNVPFAQAQLNRTAQLTLANSTDATLTIKIRNSRSGQSIEIIVPPLSERKVQAPAGLVEFAAIASRSAPVLDYYQTLTLSNGRVYTMNLTPADFGATFMADRPSFDQHSSSGSSAGGSANAATKYHWNICRNSDGYCRPSNACVATRAEMDEVIRANGHTNVWYTTGEQSGTCGSSIGKATPTSAAKYHWNICRNSDGYCRPSNACVATRAEMDEVIRANGHVNVWYTTGERSGNC